MNLVDLAGSEKTSKTGTTCERLKEATKINLSLTTLCHVIHALTSKSSTHIPYRDSTLTRMLQDSLGGNTKTMMISTIGPSEHNYHETMSTLRQASRAKKIKNQPKINVDMKDQLLMEYQKEIEYLRMQLELQQTGMKFNQTESKMGGPMSPTETNNLNDTRRSYINKQDPTSPLLVDMGQTRDDTADTDPENQYSKKVTGTFKQA